MQQIFRLGDNKNHSFRLRLRGQRSGKGLTWCTRQFTVLIALEDAPESFSFPLFIFLGWGHKVDAAFPHADSYRYGWTYSRVGRAWRREQNRLAMEGGK